MRSLLRIFGISALFFVIQAEEVILKPIGSSEPSSTVALIFIQGARCPTDRYIPLLTKVQESLAANGITLWVGIPQFLLDAANPLQIDGAIKDMVKKLKTAGYSSDNQRFFVAGHSLGGAMVQDWTSKNGAKLMGQVLLGAYLTRKYDDIPYPVPTMTIGGELDGLSRPTRIAESYLKYILSATDQTSAKTNFPVIILEGVSHNQFSSGDPPVVVKQRDLKPEVSMDQAHDMISEQMTAFIQVQLGDKSAQRVIEKKLTETGQFVAPIISAFQLEGNYYYKKPCYCKNDLCDDEEENKNCQGGSQWSEFAQKVMAGLPTEVQLTVSDGFHHFENTPHVAHLLSNPCQKPDSNCKLEVTTVSDNIYTSDDADTAVNPISANEVRVKMISRQAMWQAAGFPNPNFDTLDDLTRCQEINDQAIQIAFKLAGDKTLARYQSLGTPILTDKDLGPYNAGPLFVSKALKYDTQTDSQKNKKVVVEAPTLKFPTDYGVSNVRGFHYCKLLSPARVLEWVYVDSLREKDGIANGKIRY